MSKADLKPITIHLTKEAFFRRLAVRKFDTQRIKDCDIKKTLMDGLLQSEEMFAKSSIEKTEESMFCTQICRFNKRK